MRLCLPGFAALVLLLGGFPSPSLSAQSLGLELDAGDLHIRAPGLRFIDGEALDRLRAGGAVTYVLRAAALNRPGGAEFVADELRFAVSYDLWEERFAVSRGGNDSGAISHLTAREVEDWCLESLGLPAREIGEGQFWIRLEYRVDGYGEDADSDGDSLFTLEGLIDTLSRRSRGEQPSGSIESGPFELSDLR